MLIQNQLIFNKALRECEMKKRKKGLQPKLKTLNFMVCNNLSRKLHYFIFGRRA
jgi:hypothetical protein